MRGDLQGNSEANCSRGYQRGVLCQLKVYINTPRAYIHIYLNIYVREIYIYGERITIDRMYVIISFSAICIYFVLFVTS